jgi:hypothetical protein
LLLTMMASEGEAANPQQIQAAMATLIAGQSQQMNPQAAQAALLSALKLHGSGTNTATARSMMVAEVAQNVQAPGTTAASTLAIGSPTATNSAVSGPTDAAPAKKPGVFRIGVLPPTAQFAQTQGNSTDIAESLRTLIVKHLSGPLVEVTPITSFIPVQVDAEVKQKGCDYLLYTTFVQRKTGGGGFLKKMGAIAPMISMIPMAGGVGGAIAGAAASTAIGAASSMGGLIKAKDEVTLTYKLIAPGNDSPLLTNTTKTTAKSDGEDIVSALIDAEAISVLNRVAQKP